MKNYFHINEFYRKDTLIPPGVIEKIDYHIWVLNRIRDKLGSPIYISMRSGYRPIDYELSRGRSGNSEHCFRGKGAVDLSCDPDKLIELLKLLIESEYTRVCYYPEDQFIHCDFKHKQKYTYLSTHGTWESNNLEGYLV